jgi:hypothetical protein
MGRICCQSVWQLVPLVTVQQHMCMQSSFICAGAQFGCHLEDSVSYINRLMYTNYCCLWKFDLYRS